MNNIKYQLDVFHDTLKPREISFFEPDNQGDIDLSHVVSFYIPVDLNPILILYCHEYDNQTDLYEYAINYIINNKIGKYTNLEFMHYNTKYYYIIAYFDIINKDILIRLL